MEGVQALLTGAMWKAVADIGIPAYRDEADRCSAGGNCDEYCDILGWNVRRARASLTRFVDSGARISGNHLMTAAELNSAHGAHAVAS